VRLPVAGYSSEKSGETKGESMAFAKGLMGTGIVLVGTAAALGVTNPSPDRYADFATTNATHYLETKVCTHKLPLVGNSFQDECIKIAQSPEMRTKIRESMTRNTQRQNYILFSIYQTQLNAHDLLPILPGDLFPQYQAKTLGILNFFHILSTEKDKSS
jgi:hypothetical protein